jgi:hypothetical protein
MVASGIVAALQVGKAIIALPAVSGDLSLSLAQGRLPDISKRPWTLWWWSWGELNPRPQAFFAQFYMCSRLV